MIAAQQEDINLAIAISVGWKNQVVLTIRALCPPVGIVTGNCVLIHPGWIIWISNRKSGWGLLIGSLAFIGISGWRWQLCRLLISSTLTVGFTSCLWVFAYSSCGIAGSWAGCRLTAVFAGIGSWSLVVWNRAGRCWRIRNCRARSGLGTYRRSTACGHGCTAIRCWSWVAGGWIGVLLHNLFSFSWCIRFSSCSLCRCAAA